MGAYLSEPVTEKVSKDEQSDQLSYGASSMQGWRVSQEDAHNCIIDFDTDTSFFAVYDGHGGAEVASYCSMNLPDCLRSMSDYKKGNLGKALENAFLEFDASLTKPEVIMELKQIAGLPDSDEESEDARMLHEEASLPLDEVLARYETSGIKKVAPHVSDYEKPKSPMLRGKKATSTSDLNGLPGTSKSTDDSKETSDKVTVNGEVDAKCEEAISEKEKPEVKLKSEEKCSLSKSGSEENKSKSEDIKSKSEDIKSKSEDIKSKSEDIKSKSEDIKSKSEDIKSKSEDIKSKSEDLKSKSEDKSALSKSESEKNKSNSSKSKSNQKDCKPDAKESAASESISKEADSEESKTVSKSSDTTKPKPKTDSKSSDTTKPKTDSKPLTEDEPSCNSEKDKEKEDLVQPGCSSEGGKKRSKKKGTYAVVAKTSSSDEDDDSDDADEEYSTEHDSSAGASGSEEDDDEDDEGNEDEDDSEDEESDEEDESDMCGMVRTGSEEEPGADSGCTAVVALLHGDQLYVANAGDSRCVVCRGGKAINMSFDHKPEDKIECERITKAGGKVTLDGRVNGGLNLSRAIGDHAYKANTELSPLEQMITSLPDIQTLVIDPKEDTFMVLACDGIWNHMSSQEVVDFISERLTEDKKLSSISEELFEHCLAPDTSGDGTGCDNMTAIIVKFHDLKKQSTKRQADDSDLCEGQDSSDSKKLKVDNLA